MKLKPGFFPTTLLSLLTVIVRCETSLQSRCLRKQQPFTTTMSTHVRTMFWWSLRAELSLPPRPFFQAPKLTFWSLTKP